MVNFYHLPKSWKLQGILQVSAQLHSSLLGHPLPLPSLGQVPPVPPCQST